MRILYLYPRYYYDRKMSLGRVLYGEAVAGHPGVELKFFGPGWDSEPAYNDKLTLSQNVAMLGGTWDVAWCYKPSLTMGSADFAGQRVICFNEAWADATIDDVEACRATLVVFHHENDAARMRGRLPGGTRWAVIPHCTPRWVSDRCQLATGSRPVDCLMTGVNSAATYPLRNRLRNMVLDGRLPGKVRPHPGYRMDSHEACRREFESYVDALGQAKISLCCTSRHRYSLAKIVESMMAGCAVATDCADDSLFRRDLWPHCIQLDPAWSDERIAGEIRDWLSRPDDLFVLSEAGRQAARATRTTERYAAQFVAEIEQNCS